MKKVITTFYFKHDELEALGFETEQQKNAATCVADLMSDIKESKGKFGMLLMFITEADLLGHNPVTVWSSFSSKEQQELFEDYMGKRLKMKAKTPQPEAADE